jgi:hypothetical protein
MMRYQGPEHRSRANQRWPDTSGLLSCHRDPTPLERRPNRRVPGTFPVRDVRTTRHRLRMTTPDTLAYRVAES